VSIFADTCENWPWLAMAMMDAGLDAVQSEYGGVAALCQAVRSRGKPDTAARADLARRLIASGVDVNGLGGPRVNWDGVTPLAWCLDNYSPEDGAELLAVLLEAPHLRLQVQYWVWDMPQSVVSAARYARDRHGSWALPQLEAAAASRPAEPAP
jgi:hypothetical protein